MATIVLLGWLAGCGSEAEPYLVALADANNYSFVGDLHVPVFETNSGADVEVRWAELVHDLQCHDLDPVADIDNVALIRFPDKDTAAVELGMEQDSLLESDLDGYAEVHADGDTTAHLADMSFYGSSFELAVEFVEGGGTYVLLLTTGVEAGQGARMVSFLEPKRASDVAAVDVPDGCDILDLSVDTTQLVHVEIPISGPWTFDWSGVTLNGQGGYISPASLDMLTIAHVADWTAADLEANFLDLELHATSLWSWQLTGGMDMTLDGTGDVPDFSVPGLWVLALRCANCYNPAPIFLTLLDPVEVEE